MIETYDRKRLFFAVSVLLTGIIFAGIAGAATLTVDDSGGADYTKIRDAINNSSPGDTILVYSGTYPEQLLLERQLTLLGVDNGGGKPVVYNPNPLYDIYGSNIVLKADGIRLEGFTSINATSSFWGWVPGSGIRIQSNNNIIKNNTVLDSSNYGIYLNMQYNNILTGNIISNSRQYGIGMLGGYGNKVYNNFFNNTNNFQITNSLTFNTTKAPGTNIIGGSILGGNFWAKPDGSGYSQICTDLEHDGICDSPYSIDGINTDYLPLTYTLSDDFDGNAIDPAKWNTAIDVIGKRWCSDTVENHHQNSGNWIDVSTSPCHYYYQAPPYGAISLESGTASFNSGVSRAFPYIWSGPPSRLSPFPRTGDFILELRMKYDSIQPNGDGFMTTLWENTDPAGNNPPVPVYIFHIWSDSSINLVSYVAGEQVSIADPLSFHDYRLEYLSGNYTLFVDGVKMAGPIASSLRPNTIWIGNPVFTHWGIGDWTDFTIDYVRVTVPDNKPPLTRAYLSGTPGQNNWYISDVQVTLSANDNAGGSGVRKTEYSLDGISWNEYTAPFTISKEGETTIYYRSIDNAGNLEIASNTTVYIDKTPPTIEPNRSPPANLNGWNNESVTVHFECNDTISGLENCSPDITVTTEGNGQSVEGTATDKAGNPAVVTVSEIDIDKTPPSVAIYSPVNGSEYILYQTVIAAWSASDSLSGIDGELGTVPDGKPVDTNPVGRKNFQVKAVDKAGNVRENGTFYYVRYNYSGILEPINANGSSIFNSNKNSIVPVKFQLWDARGGFAAGAIAEIYRTKIKNTITGTVHEDVVTGDASPGNRFVYNSSSNEYVFNLPTWELTNGTWQIEIRLDDGTSKYANFSLK